MTTLIAASPEAFSPSQRTKTRNSYTVTEKINILNDLNATGGWVRRTAKEHGIHHSTLQSWKRREAQLFELFGTQGCRTRRVSTEVPRAIQGLHVETLLLAFVDKRRENSYHVTPRMLVTEWKRADPEGVKSVSDAAMKARIYRFMRRNGLSFRRTTHKAQVTRTLPAVMDDFVAYVNWKAKMLGIASHHIANFDETNVYFSPPVRSTIAKKGSRTVAIRQPDSNNRCSAMLGVSMTGYKFAPYIIFQGKTTRAGRIRQELENARANHYPSGLMFKAQAKAWMDEVTMLDWVKTVWKPFTQRINGAPSMLLLDWAPAHMMSSVKMAIADCKTELEYVPKGYTSKLQVLDVGVNKPFSDYIRQQVDGWQVKHAFDAKPRRQDVSHWIKMAWLEVTEATITNTWRRIGLVGSNHAIDKSIAIENGDSDIESVVGSVNDEENLDPLAYNTCDELSDSETEDEDESNYCVR